MAIDRRSLLKGLLGTGVYLGMGMPSFVVPGATSCVPEASCVSGGAYFEMDRDVVEVWKRALEMEIRRRDPLFDDPDVWGNLLCFK